MWLRVVATICWLYSCGCLASKIPPYYDYFDDEFYTGLRDFLDNHQTNRFAVDSPVEEAPGWKPGVALGQVAGVAVDTEGRPVVFHRGSRIWDYKSFNGSHHFQGGPMLNEDVVVVLDPVNGQVLKSWGKGKFLLPHGITVDHEGNTWLTDVALHQVIKFGANIEEPELTLGEARVPGSDDHHFCKPTSVAVATTGDFYVADGYCNARILRFAPDGSLMAQFGHKGSDESDHGLYVPHGLALDEERNTICVADRENRRVLCLNAGLKNNQDFGEAFLTLRGPNHGRVFDVAISNGFLMGISGSEREDSATGFTATLDSGTLIDSWGPYPAFHNPHCIAVSKDTTTVYVGEIAPNKLWKFMVKV